MTRFGDAFLEDYLAECEDHLAAVRQALLALEKSVGHTKPDAAVTEELFRGYHSLKGLAGMVEDRRGELLADEMESYLRAVREGDVALTTDGVDTLIEGTRFLEETIAALHARQEPPDSTAAVTALRGLTADASSVALRNSTRGSDAGASSRGPLTECVFRPSPELNARGVNVDNIRGRLRALGEIVSATPVVAEGGGVAFRFLLAARVEAGLAEAWRTDGVACTAIEAATSEEGEPVDVDTATPRPAVASASAGHYVRVDLARLDDLMRMIGDLVILRARMADALSRVEAHVPAQDWRSIQENATGIERQLRELRDGVMRVRLVPVGEIFRRMPFVVRDLARETDRRVQVVVSGQQTQIDKFLVERMMDPLLHLVRNAVSHGLEPVDERVARGKPPEGTVSLNAWAAGEIVTLEVSDDGRGIDAARVLARARQAGLQVPPDAASDERVLLDLICAPGFSTKDQSDRASGRGFGMAVVRKTVLDLGGTLRLASTQGVGTRFTIELPLTLVITDALIASVGSHMFAVPQSAVREVIEIEEASIRAIEGGEIAPFRDDALPLVRLSAALGIPATARSRHHAFIVRTGTEQVGLLVDRVISQREIVVRTTTDPLIRVPGIAGATDLGDGRAVLILEVGAIARVVRDLRRPERQQRGIA
jgi:two-component system, chemotaxis family, sensor kinase CheA